MKRLAVLLAIFATLLAAASWGIFLVAPASAATRPPLPTHLDRIFPAGAAKLVTIAGVRFLCRPYFARDGFLTVCKIVHPNPAWSN